MSALIQGKTARDGTYAASIRAHRFRINRWWRYLKAATDGP
jgi:hypothetical protein